MRQIISCLRLARLATGRIPTESVNWISDLEDALRLLPSERLPGEGTLSEGTLPRPLAFVIRRTDNYSDGSAVERAVNQVPEGNRHGHAFCPNGRGQICQALALKDNVLQLVMRLEQIVIEVAGLENHSLGASQKVLNANQGESAHDSGVHGAKRPANMAAESAHNSNLRRIVPRRNIGRLNQIRKAHGAGTTSACPCTLARVIRGLHFNLSALREYGE